MKLHYEIKKSQLLVALCVGGGAALAGGVGLYYLGKSSAPVSAKSPQKTTSIETATDRVNPHDVWRLKLEGSMQESAKKMELLEKMMSEALDKISPDADELTLLRQEIAALKEQHQKNDGSSESSVLTKSEFNPEPSQYPLRAHSSSHSWSNQDHARGDWERENKAPAIQKIVLNLNKDRKTGIKKTTDNTIPAGAFAKATLLGGVDASTSIQASNDPRPVLLRLRDHGTLPRKLRSDLKNCHVLASAYGDLSSERVYMRLEKLTCTVPQTNEISEMVVSGYVAGEDGKAGLRGVVVDKSGPLLRHSFIGGFLGGMGKFLTQTQQTYSYPLGNMTPFAQANPLTNEQMLKAGAGGGLSNALEKYADFYIKRAEQLQPVLQVAAGREVDVVFTQSTEIGETLFKSAISKQNNHRRIKTVSLLNEREPSSMREVISTHEASFQDSDPQPSTSGRVQSSNGD